jgi:hypothetical protein
MSTASRHTINLVAGPLLAGAFLAATCLAVALLAVPLAGAQAQAAGTPAQPAQPARTCVDQYSEAKGVTPATLLSTGFEIKAGWAGSLWLQKGKDAYVCNAGRVPDGQPICWTLREPLKGQPCG